MDKNGDYWLGVVNLYFEFINEDLNYSSENTGRKEETLAREMYT
jgi:hypothetical protein